MDQSRIQTKPPPSCTFGAEFFTILKAVTLCVLLFLGLVLQRHHDWSMQKCLFNGLSLIEIWKPWINLSQNPHPLPMASFLTAIVWRSSLRLLMTNGSDDVLQMETKGVESNLFVIFMVLQMLTNPLHTAPAIRFKSDAGVWANHKAAAQRRAGFSDRTRVHQKE